MNIFAGAIGALALAGCGINLRGPNAPAAEVERFEVVSRTPAFGGASFEGVGQYETVTAIAHMRVNPHHPANRAIADIGMAQRSGAWVRYKTDVIVLRPRDAAKASRVMVVDVPNRGNKLFMRMANEGNGALASKDAAGTGYTMRQGHTLVWIGWQGDVPLAGDGKVAGMELPLASDGGKPLTGMTVEEAVFDDVKPVSRMKLAYPAAGEQGARLRVRAHMQDAPVDVISWRWVSPREIEIDRPKAFDAGAIYEFVYEARDPKVMGLGLAALRDVTQFLKDETAGNNPVADIDPQVALAVGVSQSGRVLRDFIWQGFNAAPQGGRVFDGAMPLIAGAKKSFTNYRFGRPSRNSKQHGEHFTPGDQFPFSYGVTTDPVSGRTDGIFARCATDNTCPKLMHVDSSTEFWQGRASLVVTDGAGKDIALPEGVRVYLMSSTQHVWSDEPALAGVCSYRQSTAPQAPLVRALLERLAAWSRDGTPPPASSYPTIAGYRLAPARPEATGFPDLSSYGVRYPQVINWLHVVDYGAVPAQTDAARRYQLLVPVVDADGHDIAGVRLPDIDVPLATYAGWNLRREGFAQGQLCGLDGFAVPLPVTRKEGDPRLSIAQRYPSRLEYAKAVALSARALRDRGLLLQEDVDRYIERAKAERRVAP
ncbi:alpha/beta hydrolase domain-containing protein [Pseudoduganella sp. GCM10020061]|uniref:alpha/beta hydrolase domain-containing protein n=1 Tax=Pseudoduganella sp. GCM10020061 TaxID=3317345 RepID=UPI003628729A